MGYLTLKLFDGYRAFLDDKHLTAFESDKVRALLAYLAVENNSAHRREKLAGLLWPEMPEKRARASLSQALYNLRLLLGDHHAQTPFLEVSRTTIQFNPISETWVDTATITDLITEVKMHNHRTLESCDPCVEKLQEAVSLYRGEFLAGFYVEGVQVFQEWCSLARERLQRLAITALKQLAKAYESRGEISQALDCTHWLVNLDPYAEASQRQLMRLLNADGQRTAALTGYESHRRTLMTELGVEPTPETTALYEQIRAAQTQEMRHKLPGAEPSDLDRVVFGHMVGREQKLQRSRLIWQQASKGACKLLLISGEPGVGKTRLMREIVTHVKISGGQAFIGESQVDGNAPYAAFAQITRRALRSNQFNELDISNFVLADLIFITPELQISYPDIPLNSPLEPNSECSRIFESIAIFIKSLSKKKPLILVLEDLHWADSGTLALLQFLTRRCRQLPIMFLCTYREVEFSEALTFHKTLLNLNINFPGTQFKLERLDKHVTKEMLEGFFAGKITLEFLAEIYQETDGNPFYIEEVCKGLIDSGQVYFDGERWQFPTDITDMEIPQSIKIAVWSRYNRLNPVAKDILLNAAVIGREFDYETLRQVTSKEDEALVNGLDAAIKAQLIEEILDVDDERFWFSHALIPAVLRDSISGLRRARIHHKVARGFEILHPNSYQRLAYHWGKGREKKKELAYTIKAADLARRTFSNEDAIKLYTKALELQPENYKDRFDPQKMFDLLIKRGALFQLMGKGQDAEYDYKAALAIGKQTNQNSLISTSQQTLGILCISQGNLDEALEWLNKAYSTIKKLNNKLALAKILNEIGIAYWYISDYSTAQEYLERGLIQARKMGNKQEIAHALHYLGNVFASQGTFKNELIEESLALKRELGDKQGIAQLLNNLGNSASDRDDFISAFKFHEESLQIRRNIGDVFGVTQSIYNLGGLNYRQCDYQQAQKLFNECMELALEIGDRRAKAFCLLGLGYTVIGQQDFLTARELCQRSLDYFNQVNDLPGTLYSLIGIAAAEEGINNSFKSTQLLAAAENMREKVQLNMDTDALFLYDKVFKSVRSHQNVSHFSCAWSSGMDMTLDEAIQVCGIK